MVSVKRKRRNQIEVSWANYCYKKHECCVAKSWSIHYTKCLSYFLRERIYEAGSVYKKEIQHIITLFAPWYDQNAAFMPIMSIVSGFLSFHCIRSAFIYRLYNKQLLKKEISFFKLQRCFILLWATFRQFNLVSFLFSFQDFGRADLLIFCAHVSIGISMKSRNDKKIGSDNTSQNK
jgi:hypothetical protein